MSSKQNSRLKPLIPVGPAHFHHLSIIFRQPNHSTSHLYNESICLAFFRPRFQPSTSLYLLKFFSVALHMDPRPSAIQTGVGKQDEGRRCIRNSAGSISIAREDFVNIWRVRWLRASGTGEGVKLPSNIQGNRYFDTVSAVHTSNWEASIDFKCPSVCRTLVVIQSVVSNLRIFQ